MNSLTVPQELTDQIIDHLYDSPDTLKQCSFVCRSWLPSCRLHLHSRLSLRSPTSSDDASIFQRSCRFLAEHPHLAHFIREFKLRGSLVGSMLMEDALLVVFKMLTHLRTIELEGLNWVDYPEDFKSLPLLFGSSSLTTIRLKKCRFATFADFLPLVSNSPALRSLKVVDCDVSDMEGGNEWLGSQEVPVWRAYLQTLHLEGPDQAFLVEWLLHPYSAVSLARLPELHISTPLDLNFRIAGQLLQAAGAALEYFDFDFSGSIAREYNTMVLGHSPNLRTIRLRGGSGRSAMFAGNTATWSRALLSTIPLENHIEQITIFMRMDFIPLRGTHTNPWPAIEALLLELPYLRNMHIQIDTCLNIEENPIIRFVAGELEGMMPTLFEKGILTVRMDSDYGCEEVDSNELE